MKLKAKGKKDTKEEKERIAEKIDKELKPVFEEAGFEYDQKESVKQFFASKIKLESVRQAEEIMEKIKKGTFKICPHWKICESCKGCECSHCSSPPYFYSKNCIVCGEECKEFHDNLFRKKSKNQGKTP